MSTQFIQYPQGGSGSGSTGSSTGVPYVIGPLDGAAASPNGGVIGSFSVYLQSASAVNPGLVSSAAQTFAGTKTFNSAPVLSGFTTGSLVFIGSGPALLAQDNANLFWDDTNNRLGIGTNAPDSALTVAQSAFQPPSASTTVHIVGTVGSTSRICLDAYNALPGNAPGFILRKARGTGGSPSAVLAEDNLGFLGVTGYGLSNFSGITAGTLTFKASQNWTNSNQGCYFHLVLNANSTTAGLERFRINENGITQLNAYAGSGGVLTTGSGGVIAMGSVSLTTQVSGILPSGNLPAGTQIGSVSLTNQVVGVLPNANMSTVSLAVAAQVVGSLTLTNQVVGVLPNANMSAVTLSTIAQVVGSISLTGQVSGILPQANIPTTLNIGSVTMTSSTGGTAYTVRMPGVQGSSSSSALTNDGLGNLRWKPLFSPTVTVISTGTAVLYTAPIDCVGVKITATGAGGGSGGAATGAGAGAGGGGAGGTAIKWLRGALGGQTLSVTVGDGGAAGTSAGGNGGGAADTTISSGTFFTAVSITASGGGGGTGNTGVQSALGGDGSTASGGDLNLTGGAGSSGIGGLSSLSGGLGGASFWGGGGRGAAQGGAGSVGNARGSGAGGADTNAGTNAGAKGAQGLVTIEEFY